MTLCFTDDTAFGFYFPLHLCTSLMFFVSLFLCFKKKKEIKKDKNKKSYGIPFLLPSVNRFNINLASIEITSTVKYTKQSCGFLISCFQETGLTYKKKELDKYKSLYSTQGKMRFNGLLYAGHNSTQSDG